jgi:hypothetical protein
MFWKKSLVPAVAIITLLGLFLSSAALNIASAAEAISPLTPADGTVIAVDAQPIAFSWSAVSGADYYTFRAGKDSQFSTIVLRAAKVTGTDYTAALTLETGTYYWSVRPTTNGINGAWSTPAAFTVAQSAQQTAVIPTDKTAIDVTAQPINFQWDAVSGASSYMIQLSAQTNFSTSIFKIKNIKSTIFASPQTLSQGTYYWRVRPLTNGNWGAWSAVRSFSIVASAAPTQTSVPTNTPTNTPVPPIATSTSTAVPTNTPVVLSAPRIVAPANAAQIRFEDQPFVYNWDPVTGAEGYHIQIATSPAFTALTYDVSPTSDGWSAKTAFAAGTYYWRVAARAAGQQGAWSEVRTVVVLAAQTVTTPPQNSPMASQVPYVATGPWNTPIGANPVYDRYSAQMVDLMKTGTTAGKIYSDTAQYSYPVYWADATTPRYNVPCSQYKCTVVLNGVVTRVEMMINVPIPDGAKQSSGNDAQMIIIDTETGIEYGFYHMVLQADGSWKADNGYQYSVYYPGTQPGFGSRGAGVPYYAGMVRPWEIRAGEINHAIAFVYQFTAATKCVYPAAQTDGTTTNPYAIPEGARIQLNPALTDDDFDRWGLGRAGKIVARAMQQYGLLLIDTGGSPKIIAENLTANTLYGLSWSDADLQYDKNVIANIPYNELRVLAMPDGIYTGAAANYGKCVK